MGGWPGGAKPSKHTELIKDIPQGTLLRELLRTWAKVLQKSERGSTETPKVSMRLVSSTHRDLEALVNEGRFRDDLYYHLNVVKLTLPPLRERASDIAILAEHFLATNAKRYGKPRVKLSDAASRVNFSNLTE